MRISEDLIRKRAEHNDREIYTLEEVSLHQFDIEKIENIDRWCKNLKILYLQNNLISKIENVGRLRQLEYLNLALNNIEKIENLQNCEALVKLDLTVNFIGDLKSIENLTNLENFEELFLMGNPCADYEGYRSYVIATLSRLKSLDGTQIERSERITAIQNYENTTKMIEQQQQEYSIKRELQKIEPRNNSEREEFTPESRMRVHRQLQNDRDKPKNKLQTSRPRLLFMPDGRPMNINEPKINFNMSNEDDCFVANLQVYKYLDSSLIHVDTQPTYLRVVVKGKIFQLCLDEEVSPSMSICQRSKITGHLTITMPKINSNILLSKPRVSSKTNKDKTTYKSQSVSLNDVVSITSKRNIKKETPVIDDSSEPPPLE